MALEKGLRSSTLKKLRLTMELSRQTAECLGRGIKSSMINNLDLNQCDVCSDAIETLSSCLNHNNALRVIRLEHCHLQDSEIATLVRAVKNNKSLLELSFRMNYAQDESVNAVVELLHCTPSLKRLDLAQQSPGFLDLSQVAGALVVNRTLSHLNLEENYVDESHIPCLCQALRMNTSLLEINLEDCDIKDGGLSCLVCNLGSFKASTSLLLKKNTFRKLPDKDQLLVSMEKNHILQNLDIDNHNWIPIEACRKFTMNRAGGRFLEPGSLKRSLWPLILSRIRRVVDSSSDLTEGDIIFKFLHGPAVLEHS